MDALPYGMSFAQPLEDAGLQDGDIVLTLGGQAVTRTRDFQDLVFGGQVTSAEVLRDGEVSTLDFPTELGQVLVDRKDDIPKGSAPQRQLPHHHRPGHARLRPERAGLQPGDGILAVNGESTPYFQTCRKPLQAVMRGKP